LPWRPERKLTAADGAAAEEFLRKRSGPQWPQSTEFPEVAAKVRSAVQIPGAAHCSLEYQRWAFRSQFRPDGHRFFTAMDRTLHIPVLQLHGAEDPFVLTSTLRRDRAWAPQIEQHILPGVGHFVHEEAPHEVNRHLLRFLVG
jgi:pimeloyl-ACP methyl ester carboxylesterase